MIKLYIYCSVLIIGNVEVGPDIGMKFHQEVMEIVSYDTYKEYTACREAERRVSTTSKSTSGEEENWDEEPPLPPEETPARAKSMAPSQENEWKLMVN